MPKLMPRISKNLACSSIVCAAVAALAYLADGVTRNRDMTMTAMISDDDVDNNNGDDDDEKNSMK